MRDKLIIFAICRQCGNPFHVRRLSQVVDGKARTCGWQCPARPPKPRCEWCGHLFRRRALSMGRPEGRFCDWVCFKASGVIRAPLEPLESRFWRQVRKGSDCWEWVGTHNNRGYGQIQSHARHLLAHRLSWAIHFGPVPKGLIVLHRCDNPPCVRPDHLRIGTLSDNTQDMLAKGRSPTQRLTVDAVLAIRARYAAGGVTQQALADEYAVKWKTIHRVILRQSWALV